MEIDESYFADCMTRLDRNGPYVLEDVLAAITVTKGNYSRMAQLLGRKRTNVRDFVLGNPTAKEALDDAREALLDSVEDLSFMAALEGDGAQMRFILSTLGKNRGYSTRHEQTGLNGGPIRIIGEEMSPEEAAEAYADTIRG